MVLLIGEGKKLWTDISFVLLHCPQLENTNSTQCQKKNNNNNNNCSFDKGDKKMNLIFFLHITDSVQSIKQLYI